jgi:hypothetical protein
MTTFVTPLMLKVALHYHCTQVTDYGVEDGSHFKPAVETTLTILHKHGLLVKTGGDSPKYRRTEALAVWIDAMRKVPLPVRKWVIPEANEAA